MRVGLAFWRDDRAPLFEAKQAEEDGRVHSGEERVDFEAQLIGKFVKIGAAILVHEDLKQARHSAGPRVREHDGFARHLLAGSSGFLVKCVVLVVRPSKDTIDFVDELDEARRLAVARMGNVYRKIGVDVRGIAAQNDDAIGEDHGFFDIVCDDEDGTRGNFVPEP